MFKKLLLIECVKGSVLLIKCIKALVIAYETFLMTSSYISISVGTVAFTGFS